MEPMPRTSAGLRGMLFTELDRLRNGEVAPARVNVLARTVGTIVSTFRLEMDMAQMGTTLGTKTENIIKSVDLS